LKRNYAGCAICDSTWGGLTEEVEGEPMFFCCAICAVQFRRLVEQVKRSTGWPTLEAIEITGDRRGRTVHAQYGAERRGFTVAFTPQGEIRMFAALGPERTGAEAVTR
jgi:hypothetical protein